MNLHIDEENCSGCEVCIESCPYDAIHIVDHVARLKEQCTGCGICVETCDMGAIVSEQESAEDVDLSEYKGVWIFAEQKDGVLNKGSLELFECGQQLGKEVDEEVCVVLLGDTISHLVKEIAAYGIEKVYVAENNMLKDYQTNAYANTLSEIIAHHKPSIVLYSATPLGRDLAPRIARRLGVGLTADCTELSIDEKEKILLQTRPAFGGNIMATIVSTTTRPQMATVRPGVMRLMELNKKTEAKSPQVIKHTVELSDLDIKTRLVEVVKESARKVNLQDAKIIIGVGRGVKSKEGIGIFEELADIIGGEIGGSRVVVEEGWIPHERQIGQTGLSVSPELYIACGVSGSIQHRAGVLNSKIIVAINLDPEAPIFSIADYKIVGDIFEIVPSLVKALKMEKSLT